MSKEAVQAVMKLLDEAAKKYEPAIVVKASVKWANVAKERARIARQKRELETELARLNERLSK